MKRLYLIVLTFVIALAIESCYKKPEASFTTNKSEYIAGDTVHLKNTSSNGHSFLWALPNGQKVTSTNADYLIPRNQGFDKLTFILTAYSKKEKKSSSVTNTVDVIPSSMFAVDSMYSYYPLNVASAPYKNNWWINAYFIYHHPNPNLVPGNDGPSTARLTIGFPGTSTPAPGTYLLQPNDTLAPGHAYVKIERSWWENAYEDFVSLSGQLDITITNGKLHVVFSHVDAQHTDGIGDPYPNAKISGDITVP